MSAEAFRQTIEEPSDRIIVALDNMDWEQAGAVMEEVGSYVGLAKANAIAQRGGWEHAIRTIKGFGALTMADAKYKDVPSTMENHVLQAAECGPQFITIHADNEQEALEYAVSGKERAQRSLESTFIARGVKLKDIPRLGGLLGITVLTSINEEDCISIYGATPKQKVMQFAHTALEAGLDGIVCSGKELDVIRADSSLNDLLAVVPGITPEWAKKADDQSRVVTPGEAVQRGADYIVVGRAITKPPAGVSRAEAAQLIAEELAEAL